MNAKRLGQVDDEGSGKAGPSPVQGAFQLPHGGQLACQAEEPLIDAPAPGRVEPAPSARPPIGFLRVYGVTPIRSVHGCTLIGPVSLEKLD